MKFAMGSVNLRYFGEWIPVEKRLPEPGKTVLLTAYGKVIYGRLLPVENKSDKYPVFEVCSNPGGKNYRETTEHGEYTKGRITAWMRLPKPYEEERHETY